MLPLSTRARPCSPHFSSRRGVVIGAPAPSPGGARRASESLSSNGIGASRRPSRGREGHNDDGRGAPTERQSRSRLTASALSRRPSRGREGHNDNGRGTPAGRQSRSAGERAPGRLLRIAEQGPVVRAERQRRQSLNVVEVSDRVVGPGVAHRDRRLDRGR